MKSEEIEIGCLMIFQCQVFSMDSHEYDLEGWKNFAGNNSICRFVDLNQKLQLESGACNSGQCRNKQ